MSNIKDHVNPEHIGGITAPELKGTVTVMLSNAKTGEIEQVVRGENLVTDALKDILETNHLGVTNSTSLFPIYKKLFGGVLCFAEPITASAGNYYPPAHSNNPVIAHGGQTTYTDVADDRTRGNPNTVESGEITGGYKHVWDFATTQGNGTFNTVSLTHKDTGDFWLFNGAKFAPFESLTPNNANLWRTGHAPQLYDTINDIAYQIVPDNSTKLTIWKIAGMSPQSKCGLMQPIANATRSAGIAQTKQEFTLAHNSRQYYYMYFMGTEVIHCLYCNGGSTVEREIIDLSDNTKTTNTFTVPNASLGGPGDASYNAYSVPIISPDKDDYIYIRANDNNSVYKIYYPTPSEVYEIDGAPTSTTQNNRSSFIATGHMGVNPWAGFIVSGHGDGFKCKSGDTDGDFNINWNGSGHMRAYQIRTGSNDNQLVYFAPRENIDANSQLGNILNKLYLATIFNLPSPITKTSTQTMKIVYEITKASSGGS